MYVFLRQQLAQAGLSVHMASNYLSRRCLLQWYDIPHPNRLLIELRLPSSGHYSNAQISQEFLRDTRIFEFQSDKESIPTPVPAVTNTHSHLHPTSILRSLRQLGRAPSAPIQLGPGPQSTMGGHYADTDWW